MGYGVAQPSLLSTGEREGEGGREGGREGEREREGERGREGGRDNTMASGGGEWETDIESREMELIMSSLSLLSLIDCCSVCTASCRS